METMLPTSADCLWVKMRNYILIFYDNTFAEMGEVWPNVKNHALMVHFLGKKHPFDNLKWHFRDINI